jgi:integrase
VRVRIPPRALGGDVWQRVGGHVARVFSPSSPSCSPPIVPPAMLASSRAPKLLQQMRRALRVHHYSPRTEETYVAWVRRFVRFHGLRHPDELGRDEIRQFLTALADRAQLSASSQTQALSALIFLYREVLNRDPGSLGDIVRAKQPSRLPVVLTREEVQGLMGQLQWIRRVVGILLYGSGLRLLEALQLRVKDVDFAGGEIRVRRAKGAKDRVTVLPGALTVELERHLVQVRRLHQRDLARGAGKAPLPNAFERKAPVAAKDWSWQVCLSSGKTVPASFRRLPPAPHSRVRDPARRPGRRGRGRHSQAGHVPQSAAFLRDASPAGWLRHPYGSGIAGAPGCCYHDDLHPRAEPGRAGCTEPGGPAVGFSAGVHFRVSHRCRTYRVVLAASS